MSTPSLNDAIKAAANIIHQHYYKGEMAVVAEDRIAHVIEREIAPILSAAIARAESAEQERDAARLMVDEEHKRGVDALMELGRVRKDLSHTEAQRDALCVALERIRERVLHQTCPVAVNDVLAIIDDEAPGLVETVEPSGNPLIDMHNEALAAQGSSERLQSPVVGEVTLAPLPRPAVALEPVGKSLVDRCLAVGNVDGVGPFQNEDGTYGKPAEVKPDHGTVSAGGDTHNGIKL